MILPLLLRRSSSIQRLSIHLRDDLGHQKSRILSFSPPLASVTHGLINSRRILTPLIHPLRRFMSQGSGTIDNHTNLMTEAVIPTGDIHKESSSSSSSSSSSHSTSTSNYLGYWLLGTAGMVFAMVSLGGITRLTRSG